MIFMNNLSHTYSHCDRGKETFETHVWMLKTLLRGSAKSLPDKKAFLDYVIAASYRKMYSRMTKITLYYDCLQNQKTFSFKLPPKEPEEDRRTADQDFFDDIPALAVLAKTSMVNLKQQAEAANVKPLQPIEIYNESTYIEFHELLCELLSRFKTSLKKLVTLKERISKSESESSPVQFKDIKIALSRVRVLGRHLRVMARSSAIESHLQNVSHLLDVSDQNLWTPGSDDTDFSDFERLKPYSLRKGKALLPWQSYRDWLMLMVHYFGAASVLTKQMLGQPGAALSITIMSPPVPDDKMLTWIQLLENERFFPKLETESSGKDYITFLRSIEVSDYLDDNNEATSHLAKFSKSLKEGPLHSGCGSKGTYHAEAYFASLLTFAAQSDGPSSEGLDSLTSQAHQITKVLDQIKVGHSFILFHDSLVSLLI